MKPIIKNSLYTLLAFAFFVPVFMNSCANTSTPPSGGDKDTLPPILVECFPPANSLHHPVDKRHNKVYFKFDEYVKLNDAPNNIFLSPPQEKPVKASLRGKKVVIQFEEPLDSNTTYTIDLGLAIQDNNEGNQFPRFVHTFSTGDTIDSLFVSGTVQDSKTLFPIAGAKILFHTNLSDTAVYKVRPISATKTDSWGYFTVRNLKPGKYMVFAISDLNNNNRYDPDNETIAFLDTLYVPYKVVRPDSPELQILDMKDTVNCLSRPSELTLSLFKEISSRQFLKNKKRESERMLYVTFGAPNAEVLSYRFLDLDPKTELISQYNTSKDSLVIWINSQERIKDTLQFEIKYRKTDDSLKILVEQTDTIRMIGPKKKFKEDEYGDMVEIRDTVAKYTLTAVPENIDQDGMTLEFDYPLIKAPFDSISITGINTRQQRFAQEFTVTQDSACMRIYNIRMKNKLEAGYEYIFKFPHRLFVDINGLPCDSLEKKFSLPTDDKLSSIKLILEDVEENYYVELTDIKRDKVFRKFYILQDTTLMFPYLKAGNYCIRISQDKNKNGLIDTGSLKERRQPEKVVLYRFGTSNSANAYQIDLPEKMDIEQTINLKEMFM